MASEAQVQANRANARKSTGPKTAEGKAASRRNAITHGLSASLLDVVDNPEVERQTNKWRGEIRPVGLLQETLFEQAIVDTIRVKRCHELYFTMCDQYGKRSAVAWDQDKAAEAARLFNGINKAPGMIARELENTTHGIALKRDTWVGLESSLLTHKTWTDNQRTLALDLLGIHPDLRDASTPIDPCEGDVYEHRVAFVSAELDRLDALLSGPLMELDVENQATAAKSLGAEMTKPLRQLDRYERAALNRRSQAMRQIKNAQLETPPAPPVEVVYETPQADEVIEPAVDSEESEPELTDEDVDQMVENIEPEPVQPSKKHKGSTKRLNRRQRRALAAKERKNEANLLRNEAKSVTTGSA